MLLSILPIAHLQFENKTFQINQFVQFTAPNKQHSEANSFQMGGNLSLLAQTTPSIALSSYIDVLDEVHYVSSLNQSQFLKTCKALDPNGEIVIKLFIKPNDKYELSQMCNMLRTESLKLSNCPSILNYSKIVETNRAVYLIRQHIKSNLYDRLSSRPYLTPLELKFIVFQLLKGLQELHDLEICHGDLKTENILINSWNWVILTDLSSFIKPEYLPEDNPAEYSFYFDTSNRRNCYVAPERFNTKLYDANITKLNNSSKIINKNITAKMDIFSAGCCIAELFSEGTSLFNLSELFKYKNNEFNVRKILSERLDHLGEESEIIINLIMDMINVNPDERLSCKELLAKYKGILFPNYLDDFIYDYFKLLAMSGSNINSQHKLNINKRLTVHGTLETSVELFDNCLNKLYRDFHKICQALKFSAELHNGNNSTDKTQINRFYRNFIGLDSNVIVNLKIFSNLQNIRSIKEESALLFVSFLIHSLRCLTTTSNKIKCLELLTAFAQFISDENKLNRVIPYLMLCLENFNEPKIQALAIQCLYQILIVVETVSQLNEGIFVDYILPRIKKILQHNQTNIYVRIVLSNCIGDLVAIAKVFQKMAISNSNNKTNNPSLVNLNYSDIISQYDRTLNHLVENIVIRLLTDNDLWVKIALLKNILPLCEFFKRDKTNDIILSHLITYLNDRNYLLRMTLVEIIPSVAILLGPITLEQYILPLLVQTLNDSEESVIISVLSGLKDLCKTGLINKKLFYDLANTISILVLYPNYTIRQLSISILYEISQQLTDAEIYCKLYPIIRQFFSFDVEISLDLMVESCRQPVSRSVYNLLCSWSLRASNSLFWQQVPNAHIDSFGNNIYEFITKDYIPSNYGNLKPKNNQISKTKISVIRSSKNTLLTTDQKHIPLTTEDKLWIDKFKNIGLQERELWKLEVLRNYVLRTTRNKNRSTKIDVDPNEFIPNEYLNATLPPNIMPRNVFFDVNFYHNKKTKNDHAIFSSVLVSKDMPSDSKNMGLNDSNNNNVTPSIVNYHGSLIFKTKASSTTTTQDIKNVYVQLEPSKNHRLSNSENIPQEDIASYENHYFVKNSYDGDIPTIKEFLSRLSIQPTLREYKEFGPQTNVHGKSNDISENINKYVATLADNIHYSICGIDVTSDNRPYLLTSSLQGIINLWDISKIVSGKQLTSNLKYECDSSITHMSLIPGYDTALISLENGKLLSLRIRYKDLRNERIYLKLQPVRKFDMGKINNFEGLELEEHEHITKFKICVNEEISMIVALTNTFRIMLIDLRDMKLIDIVENPLDHGAICSLEVNSTDNTLLIGTIKGIIDIWDLRFKILVRSFTFGDHTPITRIEHIPFLGNTRVVVVGGSNDVLFSTWDYNKLQCRQAVLMSNEPISVNLFKPICSGLSELKYQNKSDCSIISSMEVCANLVAVTVNNTSDIILFNLRDTTKCKIVSGPNKGNFVFATIQGTTNLSFILMKLKPTISSMRLSHEVVSKLKIGQIGYKPILFASDNQNLIQVYQ